MTVPDPFRRPLDTLQSRAVESLSRRVVVRGGPGSGKTRVIAERLYWLLGRKETPLSIVCVPLSKRGRGRIQQHFVLNTRTGRGAEILTSAMLTTVGEIAADFLNQIGGRLIGDTGKFNAWDGAEVTAELSALLGNQGTESQGGIGAFASLAALYSPRDASASKIMAERLLPGWDEIIKSFHERLVERDALMTDDIVSLAILAMEKDKKATSDWARVNCKHILLDNFENAKPLWYNFLSRLLPSDGSMMMAVDPGQAVQSWQGGEPNFVEAILAEWPTTQVVELQTNYRGTRPLMEIANRLSPSPRTPNSDAPRVMRRNPEPKPELIRINGSLDEMDEYIVDQIEIAVKLGQSYRDIACLSRRLSTLRRLEAKFEKREIPCLTYASNRSDKLYGYRMDAVSLSTFHAAQGEEWKTVWVVDVNDGIIPGPIPESFARQMDEERRLFRVSATRAKKDLFLCYTVDVSEGFGPAPTRFLDELEGLLEEITVHTEEPEMHANWWLQEEGQMPSRTSPSLEREIPTTGGSGSKRTRTPTGRLR